MIHKTIEVYETFMTLEDIHCRNADQTFVLFRVGFLYYYISNKQSTPMSRHQLLTAVNVIRSDMAACKYPLHWTRHIETQIANLEDSYGLDPYGGYTEKMF